MMVQGHSLEITGLYCPAAPEDVARIRRDMAGVSGLPCCGTCGDLLWDTDALHAEALAESTRRAVVTCDYCTFPATRVTLSDEPLCRPHAVEHYGPAAWRTETRMLGVRAAGRLSRSLPA